MIWKGQVDIVRIGKYNLNSLIKMSDMFEKKSANIKLLLIKQRLNSVT